MDKLFYPAIFHPAEEGGFWVSFPDMPECLTEGDDMQQAYEMAVEARFIINYNGSRRRKVTEGFHTG